MCLHKEQVQGLAISHVLHDHADTQKGREFPRSSGSHRKLQLHVGMLYKLPRVSG
jgi:hypothetical protein